MPTRPNILYPSSCRSQHKFAEGPDCLLSDVVLFIHYYLIEREARGSLEALLGTHLPLTCQWFHRVLEKMKSVADAIMICSRDSLSHHGICNDLKRLSMNEVQPSPFELDLPTVKNQSLYVSDPARTNPASRSFTRPGK